MEYIYHFKKVSDIQEVLNNYALISKIRKGKKKSSGKEAEFEKTLNKSVVSYKFNRNEFHRILTLKDNELKDTTDNKIEKFNELFSYKIIYHFPYKIKNVAYNDKYEIKDDGKTLIIDLPKIDKKLMDFKVSFE